MMAAQARGEGKGAAPPATRAKVDRQAATVEALTTCRLALMKLRLHGSSWWDDDWRVSSIASAALDATDRAVADQPEPKAQAITKSKGRVGDG